MPGSVDYTKISIVPDPDTREWWEATKDHKFLVRQCNDCGHLWFPPQPACSKCGALDMEGKLGWKEISGKGTIYSYIVVVQPILAHLVGTVPYVVANVELDDCKEADGTVTRVPALMLDDEDKVAVGLPVELAWDPTNQPEYLAPRWRVSGTAPNTWRFPG